MVTPSVPPPEQEGELNYISKYLIQYIPVKKTHTTGKRATGARVLTSSECAAEIFEEEERKKKEKEEKETRKTSKELKKKEREKVARQKAEKAAQRKEEAAKKRELAAKRREEAAKKKSCSTEKGI